MGNITKPLAVLTTTVFIALISFYIVKEGEKIKLQSIELKSLTSEMTDLENKYDSLNLELKEVETKSKKQIDDLNKKRQKLEAEKKRLEHELQAKNQRKLDNATTAVTNRVTNTQTASASSGDKYDLMRQAGIPERNWRYVDSIISKESGWRHTVWNTAGSGAYGLCQSLPASKMASAGSDYMTNPVTQLKWCNSYAHSRYGSWANAYSFWEDNKWW